MATPDEKEGDLGRSGSPAEQRFPHPSVASDPAWAVEWIELPRGLSLSSLGSARTLRGWSRSSRPSSSSVDSQDLPEVLGPWCWEGVGEPYPHEGDLYPSPARFWLPLPERGGAIRPAVRPPPPVCSARRLASVGGRAARAFGADVSASRAISLETLLHGDGLPGRHTPFLWAWAAAARSAGTDGGGWGE